MNVTLRPWQSNDLKDLVAMANNEAIAKYMADVFPHPYGEENGKAFIEMANSKTPPLIFAIIADGKPAGSIGLHPQGDIMRKNSEVGYWLAQHQWGKGIAAKALAQIVEYGFKTTDTERIFARIFHTNLPSQKLVEKAGFVLEGRFEKTIYKNGEFLDELIYAIRKPKH